MAPEIHLREAYSFGVDFWSAAVVLYWMLTGRVSYSTPPSLLLLNLFEHISLLGMSKKIATTPMSK